MNATKIKIAHGRFTEHSEGFIQGNTANCDVTIILAYWLVVIA